MIEKLSEYKITSRDGSFINVDCNTKIINTLVRKTNELVDAINPILEERESQIKVYEETMEMVKRNDPYTEQKKWIGKLCRVETGGEYRYGILKDVSASHPTHPFNVGGLFFRVCEPVKPDDDIIYKGDDNE